MKSIITTIFLGILIFSINAQTPQAFKYQAVVRDNLGDIVANQEVNFRFSIRDEIPVGPILYQETQLEFTDAYGRANLEIGRGDETIGIFEDIDWGDDERYLEVELDLEGGTTFVSMGTTQLLAVPYALYAESTGDTSRWKKADNDLYYNNGNIGVGTNSPQYNLDIYGSSTGQSRLRLTNPDNSKILLFGSGNDLYNSSITFHDGDALRFMRYDGGYSELMRIQSDGNVGIGTPIPAEKLSILGNIELRVEGYDPYIRLNSDDAGDGTTEYIWSEDAKGLAFGDTHGSPQVLIEYVTGNVGIGTDAPEESAILDLHSSSKGFLPPRMSLSERTSIASPAAGLLVYQTTAPAGYYYYNGAKWLGLTGTGSGAISTSVLIDSDANFYQTITIGNQVWMAENLQVTHYRNGDSIPNVNDGGTWSGTSVGAYCWYENDQWANEKYGPLYNWYAVDDSRGLCPEGWHVPTSAEWTTLTTYLGGPNVAGGKMKATCDLWNSPNIDATNSSSFSGLPGGGRYYDGYFNAIGNSGIWWSSTENSSTSAWGCALDYGSGYVTESYTNKPLGFSVRCLRD